MIENINLEEDERIDDLERNGLKIIQNKKEFCFGIDAVLLSGFVKAQTKDALIDLGTGTGILPLLLSAKTGADPIVGLEIQKKSADMARRSVALNHLEKRIRIVEGDLKEACELFGKASFDVVTSNPPYIKEAAGIVNPASSKAIARHEILCTFRDVAKQAKALLKPGGKLFLVHRPQRLAELINTLKEEQLEPKRIRFVHSFADAEASLILLEAASKGGVEMRVEKPLIIYREPGKYTDEIYEEYGF